MPSRSFQGESSVLRVRLRVIKTHYEYALAEQIRISRSANAHHFHLVHIRNGQVHIPNQGWGAWPYAGLSLLKV